MRVRRCFPSTTLVLCLIAALVFLDSSPAEAKKKPKPPPAQWTVELPDCDTDFDMCGAWQTTYADQRLQDGVAAEASTEGRPPVSRLGFAIFKCDSDELCWDTSPYPVTLRGFEFEDHQLGEGPPCVFPQPCGTGYLAEQPLPDPQPATCLACFINMEQHPYWGDPPQPEPPPRGGIPHPDDYRYFYFEVAVPGEFEEMEIGDQLSGLGDLDMALFTDNNYLATGLEDHHVVRSQAEAGTVDVVVTRGVQDGQDAWTVDVTVPAGVRFEERYRGCGRTNPQDKCVGGWVYKVPLWAVTSQPLRFQATWIRSTE